uniref:DNA-directed RNA polymerase subunit beta'' n=1 Tax=Eunotogramma sp. TaxID=2219035 RepID=A0A2U9NPD7_9STRA|nr:RNA polymerase beta' subunit [Eunotogramma sp.]
MKNYTYQNTLISKKQLKQLLAWSFTKYDSMQACSLADELKYLGFKYASQAGISISIEDLRVPFTKNLMLQKANQEILNAEKICLKGKITDVERFQKIIDTWSVASESLKDEVVSYFKTYDPLNSVYIMAFSGARGNLSQVRQLVGMRGLMSDPSGEILKLPIKKNFREGLTITDYLMSGYGARKGIVDTALKTANSGYLTRRLIDVAQDIIIREKDCLTSYSFLVSNTTSKTQDVYNQILGRVLNKSIYDLQTNELIAKTNTQITPSLIRIFEQRSITNFYIRSPLTCNLYRSICQKCYGWDLANENLVDIGEAIGIIAGQSIGEPGTQLTMRTFHTGGIFTSEAKQQIISPVNGIIKFSKILKTLLLRTNRGEDVLLTKNSGSLIIIPDEKNQEPVQIELLRNTIIFVKSNQYIKKSAIIGELTSTEKQTRTEIKPIFSDTSGEIFMPRLKNRINLITQNRLLWVLSGQVYQAPMSSFLNFYTDHKINKNSYIFRTKLINHYPGFINSINTKSNIFQRIITLVNNSYCLFESNIQKIQRSITNKNYLFNFKQFKYLLALNEQNSNIFLKTTKNTHFGTLVTNKFKTLTGGTMYFDQRIKQNSISTNNLISYFIPYEYEENGKYLESLGLGKFHLFSNQKKKKKVYHRSLIWLSEETFKLNCDKSILLVEHGNFISENFEIIPNTVSKLSGIVIVSQKNNLVQEVSILSGFVYQGKNFDNLNKKVFYPGEILLDNIKITQPSLCEHIVGKFTNQLLIRPLEIYEVPLAKPTKTIFNDKSQIDSLFSLKNSINCLYRSTQKVKSTNSINLIANVLDIEPRHSFRNNITIELGNNLDKNSLNFRIFEKLCLNQYIPAHLKYANLSSCFLVESNQFVDSYTTLGYFESVILNSLEVVKFKSKRTKKKEVFLISNKDCLVVKKEKANNKTVNDLLINNVAVNQTGRILVDNGKFLTIQKGRPYFFPNCKNEDSTNNSNLQYKLISFNDTSLKSNRTIYLNYYDITKRVLIEKFKSYKHPQGFKVQFPKMFIKKNGKLYSSAIPIFLKNFSLTKEKNQIINNDFFAKNNQDDSKLSFSELSSLQLQNPRSEVEKCVTLFLKSSELITNHLKLKDSFSKEITRLKLIEYPYDKLISIHSITEDYFEQEVNSVYCKHGEFIENRQIIGLLNFEKEITGDIVQGLPRVEELLEARKKKSTSKYLATNQKKGLLIQKTSIDPSFEFRKLGTTIKENEKINPHNLLKVYFNYYGLKKRFFCNQSYFVTSYRLTDNYEASYRSFKKVQLLILNAVQSVYNSQGVSIANKHLEVIIKQMTTKVLITHEGHTPLLPREVVDLYHIEYINKTIQIHKKQPAYYVPLLLGITKAALNNPSFISAASFQETTRVLTKAAIEGRIDWLRGLKENIIIGHLIPAGTGYQNYSNCFSKTSNIIRKLAIENVTFEREFK